MMHKVIPAQPDWYVAEPVGNGDGKIIEIDYNPVIAWVVTVDANKDNDRVYASAVPVTADGEFEELAIKSPDGRLATPFDEVFDDEQALIDRCNQAKGRHESRN